jgi:hypothetical protein
LGDATFGEGLVYMMASAGNRFPLHIPYADFVVPLTSVITLKVFDKCTGDVVEADSLESKIKFHFEYEPLVDDFRGVQLWFWSYEREKMESYGCTVDETTWQLVQGEVDFWCSHLTDFVMTSAVCASNSDCTSDHECAYAYCNVIYSRCL